MAKKYKIERVVWADSISEAEAIVSGGETTYIELLDEIKDFHDMGFVKTNKNYDEQTNRNKVVPKI